LFGEPARVRVELVAAKKTAKKRKIQASEVEVGNRTLEAVLIEWAEHGKEVDARIAEARERSARAEEIAAEAMERSNKALETIGSLLRDFHAFVLEMRADNARRDERLAALEKPAAE
jgi:hypothetical protein